jgi:hypothetical protein
MAITGTGKVVTDAGTAKRVFASTSHDGKEAVFIRALKTNTKPLTLGDSAVVESTGANGFDILQPGEQFKLNTHGNVSIDISKIYFDVEVNGEGVISGSLE